MLTSQMTWHELPFLFCPKFLWAFIEAEELTDVGFNSSFQRIDEGLLIAELLLNNKNKNDNNATVTLTKEDNK